MKRIKRFQEFDSNEIINEGLASIVNKVLNFLLSPITLPTFINLDTQTKLNVIEKQIEKYLEKKSFYKILDDIRYDIEMPSQLLKVTKQRNELSELFKKYPTLEDYKKGFCKYLRKWNLINFRNKIDIEYICQKIMEMGPENEELKVNQLARVLRYDYGKNKVVKRPFPDLLRDLVDEEQEEDENE